MRFNKADNSTFRASALSVMFSVLFCYLVNGVTDCQENFNYCTKDYIKKLQLF